MLSKLFSNKKYYTFGLFAAVLLSFLLVQPAHADIGQDLANLLGDLVYAIALGIGGLFIGIGGLALDITIQELIIKMGHLLKGDFGAGISQIWQIIRDLFNIVFIFSFIFIGIKTILNAEDSGTRRALGHLIVAALFINFSMLIALTVIDFTNIAATQIYNLVINSGGMTGAYEDEFMKVGNNSITGAFMETAKLTSYFGTESSGIKGMDLVIYSLLMMIFFIMTGIIFLFGAYHVIYRFVALCIYLILSPVLFLGWVLPNFQSYTDKWLKGLLRQSFFAPAFLFLLYVSLVSLSKLQTIFVTEGKGYTTIMDGAQMTPNGFTIFIFFAIVIGFLYASVKVGDMMGISGAKAALGAIGKAQSMGRQFVGNATFGAAAGLGRATVGLGFHKLSESDALKDAASRRGFGGIMSRQLLKGSRIVGDASFDVRKVGGVGKTLDIGDGGKGGYKTRTEEIEKKEKEFAQSLGEVDEEDTRVNYFIERKTAFETRLKELKKEKEKVRDEALEDELQDLKEQKANIGNKALEKELSDLKVQKEGIAADDYAGKERNAAQIADVEAKLKEYKAKETERLNKLIKETDEKLKESVQKQKDEYDEKIEGTEKDIKDNDASLTREKNRRQIGAAVDPAKVAEIAEKDKKRKDDLKAARTRLVEAVKDKKSETEQIIIAEEIKKINEERKELAKEMKEKGGTLGYAGVLEKRNWFVSTALGRVVSQDHEAGEAIRKQFTKGSAKDAAEKK